MEEIITIENLQFKITYDETLTLEQRQDLINQIKDKYNLNQSHHLIMNLSESGHVDKSLMTAPNILNLDAYTELPEKMKKLIKE